MRAACGQDKVQKGEYTVVPGFLPGCTGADALLLGEEVMNQGSKTLWVSVPSGKEETETRLSQILSDFELSVKCTGGTGEEKAFLGRLMHRSGLSRYLITMENNSKCYVSYMTQCP